MRWENWRGNVKTVLHFRAEIISTCIYDVLDRLFLSLQQDIFPETVGKCSVSGFTACFGGDMERPRLLRGRIQQLSNSFLIFHALITRTQTRS